MDAEAEAAEGPDQQAQDRMKNAKLMLSCGGELMGFPRLRRDQSILRPALNNDRFLKDALGTGCGALSLIGKQRWRLCRCLLPLFAVTSG